MEYPIVAVPLGLTAQEQLWVAGIIATQGPNRGHLRASKPKVTRMDMGPDPTDSHGYYRLWEITGGECAYIWRMVAFYVSPNSRHHHMPATAEMDLPGRSGSPERRAIIERLDAIVSLIVDAIPVGKWHGIARWSRVL